MRVVRGSATTVAFPQFQTSGGGVSTVTGESVTLASSDGTALTAPSVSETNGIVSFVLTTTHTTEVECLTAVLSATVDSNTVRRELTIDVVDGFMVEVSELRGEPGMDSVTKFPTSLLEHFRDEWEDEVEHYLGRSYVGRFLVCELVVRDGKAVIDWAGIRSVEWVKANGVAVTDYTLLPAGIIELPTVTTELVTVGVKVKDSTRLPSMLRRELIKQICSDVKSRGAKAPTNAMEESFEGRTVRFLLAGAGRPSGTPTFDVILNDYSMRVGGIA